MLSPASSDDGTAGPIASPFASRRASVHSQDLSGRGSDSGKSVPFDTGGRVSKHLASHGARRYDVVLNTTCPQPATTQPSAPPSQWNMVLDALAELKSEINQLKSDRRSVPPPSPAQVATGASASPRPPRVNEGAGPSHGPTCPASPGNFSGFGEASSDMDVASVPCSTVGPLLQSAKVFGPLEVVSDAIDGNVAEMVNFLFDRGLREDNHKALCEDKCVLRPSNCPAVECNPEVLDALQLEARTLDFCMKEVNKDVLRAATIITRSLLALDKVAQDEEHPVVAQEVAMINSALDLLGNANFKNNLARRFVLKRELNQKFTHLCSEKVPMTRFLFGDDVSKSVKQIEESVKLKSTITAKKPSYS
ncbi:hypothetical protein E2C01_057221 [Portunus trituberculatus]|uniref:Uncharacterized protein n=1 Tax=Portunus trituberculatus TaxID=210409 RepID=A0A5B7H192_PORTR|nr:hypothetical protein [Portunus trituberculatus]